MAEIFLFGASDDLIEVEGSIYEEFNTWLEHPEDKVYIAVSDGSLFHVSYDKDGIWRFAPIVVGSCDVSIKFGIDDDKHSDIVTMTGDDLNWVALTSEVKRRR
jgi:hypothetical protein